MAFACALSVACVESTPVSPSANVLVVHAILDRDSREQYVIVQRTMGIVTYQEAVTGAEVTLTTPEGTMLRGEEVRDSMRYLTPGYQPRVHTVYRISLDKYGVTLASGKRYRLRVRAPNSADEVTGETTIPPSQRLPRDSTAVWDFVRARDTVRLAWPQGLSSQRFEVTVVNGNGRRFSQFADSSLAIPGTSTTNGTTGIFAALGWYEVAVHAIDQNYYDYYRRSSDDLTGNGPIMHLQGGVGLFGAVARVDTRVLNVR